jgi:hypothetical protein
MEQATDQDSDLLDALEASNTIMGWIAKLLPRSFMKMIMPIIKTILPVQILPEELTGAASAVMEGAVAYNTDFTGADAA